MLGRRQIAQSALWRIVEVMGAEIFTFGAFIISARLLLPAEVGVVAQATLFIMTAQLLLHQGLGEALVQSDDINTSHFSSAFWMNQAVGAIAALALIAAAGSVADLLDEPLLATVLPALAPTLVLFAASGIYQAKLRRELLLRGFAFASMSASLSGGVVAVALAWSGYGVWSLVAQQWAYAGISLLVFAYFSGWLPAFFLSKEHIRSLGAFGSMATTAAFLQSAMRRLDLLILGYFLPTSQVGFFSVANRLMMSAGMLTYYSIQQIGLPVLSRLAHNPSAHHQAMNNTLRLVSLICLPTLIGLALIADMAIPIALGEKWIGSIAPFQNLCVFGTFYAMALIIGQILLSAGHAGLFVKLSIVSVIMFLTAVAVAAPFGAAQATFAGGMANLLALPAYFWALKHKLGFNLRQCFLDQWPIWVAAGTMAITVLSWSHLVAGQMNDGWLLAGSILTGGLTFMTVMLMLSYEDIKEICASFSEVLAHRVSGS